MASGEPRSFEELAVPHLELVYRVARRLAKDEHLAEDLLQETYLKAYQAFATFEVREFGVRPWLLKILHNTFLNRLARDKRRPRTTDASQLEWVEDSSTGNGIENGPLVFDVEGLDDELKQAVDALPTDFRSVLLLWATMELTYQEIADILEVPVGTVMSRLYRARQQVSRDLQNYARDRLRVRPRNP